MKILYFNSFSVVHGGAERLLFDTCTEMLERGHQIAIIIANDDRRLRNPEFWPARINRYYVPELILPLCDRRAYDRHRRTESYQDTLRYLQDIISIESPDLIHVHNFPSVEIFKELDADVPLIKTVHSFENLCETRLKLLPDGAICSYPMGKVCKAICGFEDSFRAVRVRCENHFSKFRFARFLAISDYIREVLLANGFPERKIRILPNFTRLTQKCVDVAEENRVLYVGRLTPEKGLLELIRAIRRMQRQPTLHIVGKDGVLGQSIFQDAILREAVTLGVDLDLQGWVIGDELSRAYARARLVAFSSVWPEPFGLVGIEAMLQGKPVVAFDTGGVRDWLRHKETGFLVPHGDLDQYAARIDQLLADDSLRRRMGDTARRYALERFTARRYMTDLLDIYMEVINEGAADRSGGHPEVRDAQCWPSVPV